jgi:Elongation factor G C-terminus
VIGGLNARRGTIIDSEVREDEFTAIAEVALNDMFGYSSQLRGATQGKGEFSMEYKVKVFSLDLECRADELMLSFFRRRITCRCCRMCRLSCRKIIASLSRITTKSKTGRWTDEDGWVYAQCQSDQRRTFFLLVLGPINPGRYNLEFIMYKARLYT